MALVYRIATGQARSVEDTREYKEKDATDKKTGASNGYSSGGANNKSKKQKIG